MKRLFSCTSFLLSGALLAACGGGSKNVPAGGEPGAPNGEGAGGATDAAADAALAARKAHSNPGGMWMPMQMTLPQHVENFQKMGVAIDSKVLSNPLAAPLAAVISLGGCTASFVSPQGLIVTNHHCIQGALQFNSTPQSNLVENGFLAKTLAEEKSAGPAQRVTVAQAFRDVTAQVRDGLEKIADPVKRKDEAEKRVKALQSECEKGRTGIRCEVRRFFRDAMYVLIESLEIRDIRLVYVPARSVGNYGGEIDNWAWPRHTGDFSFYRAYVGKDGAPADYSPDNVPFKPAHHLTVTAAGLKAHDFVMVTGYPGTTNRVSLASEVRNDVEWTYPYFIALAKERYAIAEQHLKSSGETAIKAAVMKQGVQNGLEKVSGVLAGLTKGDLLQRKDALDAKVKEWAAQPGKEEYKAAIEKLESLLAAQRRTARADFDRTQVLNGSRLLASALQAVRLADERTKPDAERRSGYQERDMPRLLGAQKQFNRQYDRVLDRAVFRLMLVRALQLPEAERPWLALLLNAKKGAKLDEAAIDATLEGWYKGTKLEDEAVRIPLVAKGTAAELKASKDPFVAAAQRIWPTVKAEEKRTDGVQGELMVLGNKYADAMRAALDGFLAPDANGTLRITYGTVKSFKPESTVEADWPFTTAAQILGKDKGTSPFDAPKSLLDAIKAKNYGPYADAALGGELAVDFLSDLDITGGNSGSPALNHKGELVGLAFDGTIEGVASDVVFDGATTRSISVDARYMLWVMDAIDKADHLITEMGLTPSVD
jgi:Peptidase S46